MDRHAREAATLVPTSDGARTRLTRTALSHTTTRRTFLLGASGVVLYGTTARLATPAFASSPPGPRLGEKEFFELSDALTEFGDLDNDAGLAYLANLNANPGTATALRDLFVDAGFTGRRPPETFAEIEASGALDDPAQRAVAQQTLRYWYTGVVDTPDGQRVVTWLDAVGWLVLEDFAEPPSTPLGHEKWKDAP